MKKIYLRTFLTLALIVLLSFLMLGGAFVTLTYRYTISDRKEALQADSLYVSGMIESVMDRGIALTDDNLGYVLGSISMVSGTDVMLVGTDGAVIYFFNGDTASEDDSYLSVPIDDDVFNALTADGVYDGITNLGLFSAPHYAAGRVIEVSSPQGPTIVGYAIVATRAAALRALWDTFLYIYIGVAVAVLFITLILSYFSARQQTKHLHEMAEAVERFGQGEFSVRVDDHGRKDEIGGLARSFNAMADSLALSETRRQEFVANISHELKTPMTTISGFADGILDGTIPPEKTNDYLQIISSETKRLARLVRKMLDISKLQATDNFTGHEQFDLCEVMCRMLISLEGKIEGKKLDVDAIIPEEPVMVWGEPDAITQVGYNLMDNAIKFSKEGTVVGLHIAVKDTKAYVSVLNHGETIPPDELSLIFDRFHKSDKSRSIDKDGVGLGLYIVKTILNNHKENITVTSENGVTTFTFTMTLAR